MRKNVLAKIILFSLFVSLIWIQEVRAQEEYADQDRASIITEFIKGRFSGGRTPPKLTIGGELIHASVVLEKFYKKRNFQLAWYGNNGPNTQADDLIDSIEEAHHEGLIPEHYHFEKINTLLDKLRTNTIKIPVLELESRIDLDLLLTDAFLILGCQFSAGCVNPITKKAEWFANRGNVDVASVLEKALKENRTKDSLRSLMPRHDAYAMLREALALHREIIARGGWPTVTGAISLKKSAHGEAVAELKERLIASGDLIPGENDAEYLFDETTKRAVLRFQKRHGLAADGIVGPLTRNALNVSAEKRAGQIIINMERLRWSLRDLGERYILVNIADFKGTVVEKGQEVFSMKVVVGKPYWHTPVFSAKMTYLVLNPEWNVPDSIAIEEILPKIQKAPDYLLRQNIKVIQGWGEHEKEIDPENILWSLLTGDNFPYRFRQDPGPLNPLGRIKFMFPNRFHVYLHDSPNKVLFDKHVRTSSHGCIRVDKPLELAAFLLKDSPQWTEELIVAALHQKEKLNIAVSRPIDVHILYLTAWVDDSGLLHFRNDIYGRDAQLEAALQEKPPTPPYIISGLE